ncbi:hypothetical protein CBS101457_000349 [Exobasidium rhododendri]|nr:hypothetical protein CBS101457_000349 [Exobasidium rhododendri]
MGTQDKRTGSMSTLDNLVRRYVKSPQDAPASSSTGKAGDFDQYAETSESLVPISIQRPQNAQVNANSMARSRSDSSNQSSPSRLIQTRESPSQQEDPQTPKGKGRMEDFAEYGTGRRSGESLLRWSGELMRGEAFITPLAPRVQERERKNTLPLDSKGSLESEKGRRTLAKFDIKDFGVAEQDSSTDSIRLLGVAGSPQYDLLPKGYRRVERALEEERKKRLQASAAATNNNPAPPLPPSLFVAAKASLGTEDLPVIVERSDTSDSFDKGKKFLFLKQGKTASEEGTKTVHNGKQLRIADFGASSAEARKADIAVRNRATSEPVSFQESEQPVLSSSGKRRVSEETDRRLSKQQEQPQSGQHETTIYQPAQTRPLSWSATGLPTLAGNRTSYASVVIPFDPAFSTALSLQNPTMEGGIGRMSEEHYRGLSTSTRPSINLGLLLHNRAHARFHLSALSALRPRIPAKPSPSLSAIRYRTWLPSLHHTLLCIITYAHVPATIFLDYNVVYSLVQIAQYPDGGGSSAAWWIASGIYAAAFLIWLAVVVVVWEIVIKFRRCWSNPRPCVLPIYLSSPAFTLTAIKSMALYSLLFRARFSATPRDFTIESFWFVSQNWPTVLTLLPRGVILIVVLVLYNPHSGTASAPVQSQVRDPVYFDQATGLFTSFSFIILLINAAWIAWRTILLFASCTGLVAILGPKALYQRDSTSYDWYDNESIFSEFTPHTPASRNVAKHQHFSTATDFERPLLPNNERDQRFNSPYMNRTAKRSEDHRQDGQTQQGQSSQLPPEAQSSAPFSYPVADLDVQPWAWRVRAEERLNILIMQGMGTNTGEQGASSPAAWASSPGTAEAHKVRGEPENAPVSNMEMLERRGETREHGDAAAPADSALHAGLVDSSTDEIEILSTPALVRTSEGGSGPSEHRRATSLEDKQSRSAFPLVIAALTRGEANASTNLVGAMSQSQGSSSSQLTSTQKAFGEMRDRWSSGSELSAQVDRATTAQSKSSEEPTQSTVNEGSAQAGIFYVFPTGSGEMTPTARQSGERARKRSEKLSSGMYSLDNDSSRVAVSESKAAGKKRQASTSFSSLADSLRFGRSSKSVDTLEGNFYSAAAVKDVKDENSVGKSDALSWPRFLKGQSKEGVPRGGKEEKAREDDEHLQVDVEAEEDVAVISTMTAATAALGRGEMVDEEQASQGTHETTSTEDSEERRLWSQFPEQSRRYPPGLIAFELEERRNAAALERLALEAERRRLNEEARLSGSTILIEEDEEELEERRLSIGDLGGSSSRIGEGEGLRPIKEESWSSSLNSADNSVNTH